MDLRCGIETLSYLLLHMICQILITCELWALERSNANYLFINKVLFNLFLLLFIYLLVRQVILTATVGDVAISTTSPSVV